MRIMRTLVLAAMAWISSLSIAHAQGTPTISCAVVAVPSTLVATFSSNLCMARQPALSYELIFRVNADPTHKYTYQWFTPSSLTSRAHCTSTTSDCYLGSPGKSMDDQVSVLVSDLTTGKQTLLPIEFAIEPVCSACPASAPTLTADANGNILAVPSAQYSCSSKIVWC